MPERLGLKHLLIASANGVRLSGVYVLYHPQFKQLQPHQLLLKPQRGQPTACSHSCLLLKMQNCLNQDISTVVNKDC